MMSDNQAVDARQLLAKAYEQLGYQAESAIWRNMYLTAAGELRNGVTAGTLGAGSSDVVGALPSSMIFDLLAVRLNPTKSGDRQLRVAFVFPDRHERFLLQVKHGVLTAEPAPEGIQADATLTLNRPILLGALVGGNLWVQGLRRERLRLPEIPGRWPG